MTDCQINTDGKMAGVPSGSSTGAYAVYSFKGANVKNMGKLANIGGNKKLREYPDSMTKYLDTYTYAGNYDSIGNDIKLEKVTSLPECEKLCNKQEGCAGFMLGSDQNCYMKNKNMYPIGQRQLQASNYELYTRNKGIAQNNVSCSKEVENVNSGYYGDMTTEEKMTLNTLCGLGVITEEQREDLDTAQQNLQNTVSQIEDKVKDLTKEEQNLNTAMKKEVKQMDTDVDEYKTLYDKIDKLGNKKITVDGAAGDTNLDMVSNNTKYVMWSILAIVAVMGSMKYMR